MNALHAEIPADTHREIKLAEVIGDRCLTKDQGEKVLGVVRSALSEDAHVLLDFEGVRIVISLFLNNAVGPLFEDYDRAEFDRRVSFAGLSSNQARVLECVLRNSEAYHRDPVYRKAIDEALSVDLEEVD